MAKSKIYYYKPTNSVVTALNEETIAASDTDPDFIDLAKLRRQIEDRLRKDHHLVLDLGLRLGLITH